MSRALAVSNRGWRALLVAGAACVAAAGQRSSAADPPVAVAETTVGMEGRYVLAHAGAGLRARAVDDRAPLALRIASAGREGAAGPTLYDLRFVAVRSGEHDLAEYLELINGGRDASLPSLRVRVGSVLPGAGLGDLADIAESPLPRLGGYRLALAALGVVWLAPCAAHFIWRRRRRAPSQPLASPATPNDALTPLIDAALAGELPPAEQARLERALLAHWRERLSMGAEAPRDLLRAMRERPDAAATLDVLERWLHAPHRLAAPADVREALTPYRRPPAQAVAP